MEQKIVSAFMFSEPHEQDLLWLKFNVEDPFIDQWVITESSYTFQGKHKPIYIRDVLSQSRFAPFRDKIHILQLDRNYNFDYEISFGELLKRKVKRWLNAHRNRDYELVPYAENAGFHAEIIQRQACVAYLQTHYSPEDIVIACDADEIFDFNEGKIELFEQMLGVHPTPFYIRRLIFCYDYDNQTNRIRYVPIARLKDLRNQTVQAIKHPGSQNVLEAKCQKTLVFEYTFCFTREAIAKKLSTFAHVTDLDEQAINFCLTNNISLINPKHIDERYLNNPESFYSKITLNAENAPKFLRDNLDHFRTRIVNPNYTANRKANGIEPQ